MGVVDGTYFQGLLRRFNETMVAKVHGTQWCLRIITILVFLLVLIDGRGKRSRIRSGKSSGGGASPSGDVGGGSGQTVRWYIRIRRLQCNFL